jgi:hypothetical protein
MGPGTDPAEKQQGRCFWGGRGKTADLGVAGTLSSMRQAAPSGDEVLDRRFAGLDGSCDEIDEIPVNSDVGQQ